jgi:hypothetical protein
MHACCMHTCMHAACTHACLHACMQHAHACLHACACMAWCYDDDMCMHVHGECMHVHAHMHACSMHMHACMHACSMHMHACMFLNILSNAKGIQPILMRQTQPNIAKFRLRHLHHILRHLPKFKIKTLRGDDLKCIPNSGLIFSHGP